MARNALVPAEQSDGPAVGLQWVPDDIMAFRGSFDDAVDLENVRNITKTGGSVERICLFLRMGWHPEQLNREITKLLNRLYKTDLPAVPESAAVLTGHALEGRDTTPTELLQAVENLFLV